MRSCRHPRGNTRPRKQRGQRSLKMAAILALAAGDTPGLSGQPGWKQASSENVMHLRSCPALAAPQAACHSERHAGGTVLDVRSAPSLRRVLVVDDEEPIRSTLTE